jgi:hypothetical protein
VETNKNLWWKATILVIVGIIGSLGWLFPVIGIIVGSVSREFCKSFWVNGFVALGYFLAVSLFNRFMPLGYPSWLCWLSIISFCLGHWLHRASQNVILAPESS